LSQLSPDIIFIVGDRYEIYAAATAAMVMNVPIAHASGGEITEGSIDEQIRHAITKMSHIHFTTENRNSNIILQMGEEPWRVHTVGGLWVDDLLNLKKKSRNELQKILGINLISPVVLVTYHPETLNLDMTEAQIDNLLNALKEIDGVIIFTYPNADASGRIIISKINEFLIGYPKAKAFKSLGRLLYFSLLNYCDLMVGNLTY
jgi:GDP/UDP-N,N'-diacetylbacillosamine 2-epimerase (hydrolysing)